MVFLIYRSICVAVLNASRVDERGEPHSSNKKGEDSEQYPETCLDGCHYGYREVQKSLEAGGKGRGYTFTAGLLAVVISMSLMAFVLLTKESVNKVFQRLETKSDCSMFRTCVARDACLHGAWV